MSVLFMNLSLFVLFSIVLSLGHAASAKDLSKWQSFSSSPRPNGAGNYRQSDDLYSFHPNLVSWYEAAETCHSEGRELLCFGNRTEIVNILKAFLETWGGVEMWIGKKDCRIFPSQPCASLNIRDFGRPSAHWSFSFNCSRSLNFICKKRIEETTTSDPMITSAQPDSSVVCQGVRRRDISWPTSVGGTTLRVECPPGQIGFAYWSCSTEKKDWYPENPNLSDCRTVQMSNVLRKMPIIDIAATTKELHETIQNLRYGGDVTMAVEIMDKVDDVYYSQAPTMTPDRRKRVIDESSTDIIRTCDKLVITKEAWEDIPVEKRITTANTFLTAVDETGTLLVNNSIDPDTLIETDNVVLKVVRPGHSNTGTIQFPVDRVWQKKLARIWVPVSLPSTFDNKSGVIFSWYSDLRSLFTPTVTDSRTSQVINSAVVSAKVSGSSPLNGNVDILLEHLDEEGSNPQCVYWDTEALKWSSDGCQLKESNKTHTRCSCTHLTNFAILMDIHCSTCDLPSIHQAGLTVVTMTGCLVSIFCLTICIIIFTWFRSLWGIRTTIHRNLCITLWFGEALLLAGLDKTENKLACSIVAGLLHYFFLSAFFWMFLEAFHILLLVIHVFTPKRLKVIQYYLAGYGGPAVIVGITAGMRYQDYGTDRYCWLSTENGTIWSFVGPVMAIIAFNTLALLKALWTTFTITRSKDKNTVEGLRMWIRGAAVLLPLLGITWAIGFFYLHFDSIVLAYVFAVLNSLQGFAIFLFQVLLNKKVKAVISRSIERSSFSRSGTKSSSWRLPRSKKDKSGSSDSPVTSPDSQTMSTDHPVMEQKAPLNNDSKPENGDELKEEDFKLKEPLNPRILFSSPNSTTLIPEESRDEVDDSGSDSDNADQPPEGKPLKTKLETEIV